MRWLDGVTDSMDEFEHALGNSEGQGGLVCCSPWGRRVWDTTWGLNKGVFRSRTLEVAIAGYGHKAAGFFLCTLVITLEMKALSFNSTVIRNVLEETPKSLCSS